jgi:hypothetical protein
VVDFWLVMGISKAIDELFAWGGVHIDTLRLHQIAFELEKTDTFIASVLVCHLYPQRNATLPADHIRYFSGNRMMYYGPSQR